MSHAAETLVAIQFDNHSADIAAGLVWNIMSVYKRRGDMETYSDLAAVFDCSSATDAAVIVCGVMTACRERHHWKIYSELGAVFMWLLSLDGETIALEKPSSLSENPSSLE